MPRPNNDVKRRSLNLSGASTELLDYIAEQQGVSANEAIRRAIATEAYFLKERKAGAKVLVQTASGEVREVLFR